MIYWWHIISTLRPSDKYGVPVTRRRPRFFLYIFITCYCTGHGDMNDVIYDAVAGRYECARGLIWVGSGELAIMSVKI